MAKLGVNIEPVAILRERGRVSEADPVMASMLAELGGADFIVCPLREKFSSITERDAKLLRMMVKIPLELQVELNDQTIGFSLSLAPEKVTLVPGKFPEPQGPRLDVQPHLKELAKAVQDFRSDERLIGIWVEPDLQQIKAVAGLRVDYVKLYLGHIAEKKNLSERADFLEQISSLVLAANKMGLATAIEGGITYSNAAMIGALGKMHEIVVGDSIVARALCVGMEQAVRDMCALVH